MESFKIRKTECLHVLRLDQGEYLLESICEFIKKEKITNGVVLSGIGTLDRCVLHMVTTVSYPPVEHFEKWHDKPLELSSIQGLIADGSPHLHAVVSDKDKAYSGHLEEGCRVLYLAEISILQSNSANLARVPNEKNVKMLKKR